MHLLNVEARAVCDSLARCKIGNGMGRKGIELGFTGKREFIGPTSSQFFLFFFHFFFCGWPLLAPIPSCMSQGTLRQAPRRNNVAWMVELRKCLSHRNFGCVGVTRARFWSCQTKKKKKSDGKTKKLYPPPPKGLDPQAKPLPRKDTISTALYYH